MGTFAMLKNFDFFREISNWFRPFYQENQSAQDSIPAAESVKQTFLSGLQDALYICNSDKYSFCFNLKHLPEEQSRNIISLFNVESQNFREVNQEDKLLKKSNPDMFIFTQYIQDLYRFFNLHPFRNDFRNVFSMDWNLSDSILTNLHTGDTSMLSSAARFLFNGEHYFAAIKLFEYIDRKQEPDRVVLEKLGYCYQKTGQYMRAVEYYKKTELFETNRLWSQKKIIFCYRKLNDTENALKWAQDAEATNPDDVYIQTMLGNCFLDIQKFELALEHYFKAEFINPDNANLLRPISWCAFAAGKLDIAMSYCERLLQLNPSAVDYINAGHIQLCFENRSKAMEYYLLALQSSEISFQRFEEILQFDSVYLLNNGLKYNEIKFVKDYLRYRLK
jgi:tetratricopeptide (TPR) repeat protein